MCGRLVDLRLRAWRWFAFSLLARSAHSLMLIRYYAAVCPAGDLLAWLSYQFRAVIARRASPPRSIWLKRFNRCGFLSPHPSIACVDVMPPSCLVLSLLARSVIFLICLFLAYVRMVRCRVLRSACLVDWRSAPVSRFPVPPLCPPDGEGRSVCDKLNGTARMPMIGWRRFPFSRHLVFDTG